MRVVDLANALEVEPNDALAQATPTAAAPLALNGIIEKPGDVDFIKFTAKQGAATRCARLRPQHDSLAAG